MSNDPFFNEWNQKKQKEQLRDELREDLLSTVYKEYYLNARPPDQIIIDDNDLQQILKVSKRYTANLRENKLIRFSQPVANGKVFYYLQDVLNFINSGLQEPIKSKRRI